MWRGFGDVPNYVEPFAGSLAVLLGRPHEARIETVNDLDCYLANFWRAVKWAPELVAEHADWPVNEADLHARHRDLVTRVEFRRRMKREAKYFDAEIAGWWVWGLCQWIGSGWCVVGSAANGERPSEQAKMPKMDRGTTSRLQPAEKQLRQQIPMLAGDSGASGRGIHASGLAAKLPLLSGGSGYGVGVHRGGVAAGGLISAWFTTLSARLRRTRVCCGDWGRILGRSVTESIGTTGVLLDPPYEVGGELYSVGAEGIAHAVRAWALANGDNPKLRIALCGYADEHEMPSTWECVEWKAVGGYAAAAGNTENASRERIWFSPHCELVERQGDLFATTGRVA